MLVQFANDRDTKIPLIGKIMILFLEETQHAAYNVCSLLIDWPEMSSGLFLPLSELKVITIATTKLTILGS